ncbi:MAG: hypothetical protein ACE5K4_05920 [Candidatus Hydrothermarchaeota archaeon]
MKDKTLSLEQLQLIEEYANCFDVVVNLPEFLYAKYQLKDLNTLIRKIGKDLRIHLSTGRNSKEIEKRISEAIEDVRLRREDFGAYEVVPYFSRKILFKLLKLHRKALDTAIISVLCREGILKIFKEDADSIKSKIWLGLELDMFSMLGGIQVINDEIFTREIIEKISKECVHALYQKIQRGSFIKKEKERLLRQILGMYDFKHKVGFYGLDQDLWRFFTVIEAKRLLGVNGEFVHDLIELSVLLRKLEILRRTEYFPPDYEEYASEWAGKITSS